MFGRPVLPCSGDMAAIALGTSLRSWTLGMEATAVRSENGGSDSSYIRIMCIPGVDPELVPRVQWVPSHLFDPVFVRGQTGSVGSRYPFLREKTTFVLSSGHRFGFRNAPRQEVHRTGQSRSGHRVVA